MPTAVREFNDMVGTAHPTHKTAAHDVRTHIRSSSNGRQLEGTQSRITQGFLA